MKRMLMLAVTLWLGVSATAHAQVNSPTNAASTVTGAILPLGPFGSGLDELAFRTPDRNSPNECSISHVDPCADHR